MNEQEQNELVELLVKVNEKLKKQIEILNEEINLKLTPLVQLRDVLNRLDGLLKIPGILSPEVKDPINKECLKEAVSLKEQLNQVIKALEDNQDNEIARWKSENFKVISDTLNWFPSSLDTISWKLEQLVSIEEDNKIRRD